MLLKHVYIGGKFQRTLKSGMSLSLEHFSISAAIFTQVASALLMCQQQSVIFLGYNAFRNHNTLIEVETFVCVAVFLEWIF